MSARVISVVAAARPAPAARAVGRDDDFRKGVWAKADGNAAASASASAARGRNLDEFMVGRNVSKTRPASPPVQWASRLRIPRERTATVLAGIRAGGRPPSPSRRAVQTHPVAPVMGRNFPRGNSSAYRCGGSAGWLVRVKRLGALLPLNCGMRTTREHQPFHFTLIPVTKPYNSRRMPSASQIDQIAERVERLLVRYEELQRTNALLAQQVEALTAERDSLRSRLAAARARSTRCSSACRRSGRMTVMKHWKSSIWARATCSLPEGASSACWKPWKKSTTMCKIRDAGKVKARDRIAVLARSTWLSTWPSAA